MKNNSKSMYALFYRCKREGVNSIETVFAAMESVLSPHASHFLPNEGASPLKLLKNMMYARKHRARVNHITGDAHYIALGLGRNTILTIHDVQSALKSGNLLKRFYIKLLWFYLPALIVRKITVISKFTQKELERIIPFAKHKIVVIPNPFNQTIRFSPKEGIITQPTILHIGTKENKNLERVARALEGMDCKLVILGKMNDRQQELLKASNISYKNFYDLPYQEVIECYRQCDVVSFPSLYEGFGLPILEANAIGRPVLAGDIEVLHEVAGEAAYFVDPYDVDAIRKGFVELINNSALREKLVSESLRNVKRYASENIAAQYNDLYKSISDR